MEPSQISIFTSIFSKLKGNSLKIIPVGQFAHVAKLVIK